MAFAPLKKTKPATKVSNKAKASPSHKASDAYSHYSTPVVPKDHPSERAASMFADGDRWDDLVSQHRSPASDHGAPPQLADAGKRLPESLRATLGRSIPRRTLDDISIHTDSSAAGLARLLGARAVTFGRHIAFDSGEFKPQQPAGARLLRHELFHAANPEPAFSLDRKTDALRTVLERNDAAPVEELGPCELMWLKDALLGVKDETTRASIQLIIEQIDAKLVGIKPEVCGYEPINFDPTSGARGRPSIPGVDGPGPERNEVFGEGRDGEVELRYTTETPLGEPERTAKPFNEPEFVDGPVIQTGGLDVDSPAPGRSDLRVELRYDANSFQLTDEGYALSDNSTELEALRTTLKHHEHTDRRAEGRRDELGDLPEDSELAKLEAARAQADEACNDAKQHVEDTKLAREKAYDDRKQEREGLDLNGRKAVNRRHASTIAQAEQAYENAREAWKVARNAARDARKKLAMNKEYKRREKIRAELNVLEIRSDTQKRDAAKQADKAREKLVSTMEKAIADSEDRMAAASAKVEKYEKRVNGENAARAKNKKKTKSKSLINNEKQLAKAKEQLRVAERAHERYVALWVRYWQEGESLPLTEGAQSIAVSDGGLELLFVRDPRDAKGEGAMIGYGQLEYDDADKFRAFELLQQNKGNPSPTTEQYEDFEVGTKPTLDFIMDLFVGSEGKPDTFITGSGGGVTLGPGFTGTKLGHMMAALKHDDPATFDQVFRQYGVDIVDDRGDQISIIIPPGDLVHSIADRQDEPLDIGPNESLVVKGRPAEVFKIARMDPKLLYVFMASAHDPTFRAEYVKYFLGQIEKARAASFRDVSGVNKTWEDIGRIAIHSFASGEQEGVWLLPLIHGSIAGAGQGAAIKGAQNFLDSSGRPIFGTDAAQMWWAAADKLRHTSGSRWRAINKRYGSEGWFSRLIDEGSS